MQVYSWSTCICGMLQVIFIYNISLFTWTSLFLPTILCLLIEIFYSLVQLFSKEYLTPSEAVESLAHICSLGLFLASIMLYSESMESALDFSPALVPIFLVFLMHLIMRVLKEPPLFLTPLLNLLSPPLAVCSMTGSCSSFYISVISSFFGAFGSTIIDFFIVLKPLTYVLLFITVLSVYSTKKSFVYLPFIMALASCAAIIIGENKDSVLWITAGNVALVGTVIWNNKLLKKSEEKSV